ncbi:MAG: hypothetical protein BWY54_00988 [Candidatus Dependentiae bacterium ADurb.Bin331]|nr:MAG: hypothetical protein BWY54_00988 [Candidatus Dependentiae bacterium ADurb.Bin331]
MQHGWLRRFFDGIKSIFFNGLLIILPITFTIAVFAFFFRLLKSWLAPLYRLEPLYLQAIPHSEFILVLILILLTGAIFRLFFLQRFLHMIERIASKIPLFSPVYSGIKQLVQAFTVPDKLTFQKVVFVEFPRSGLYSVGFLTSEVPSAISPQQDKRYFKVFIPTTPNPTTGFLVAVPENEIISIDLTRQEAMSLIISGGIIQPERFSKK